MKGRAGQAGRVDRAAAPIDYARPGDSPRPRYWRSFAAASASIAALLVLVAPAGIWMSRPWFPGDAEALAKAMLSVCLVGGGFGLAGWLRRSEPRALAAVGMLGNAAAAGGFALFWLATR